jgi:hypothetical protein
VIDERVDASVKPIRLSPQNAKPRELDKYLFVYPPDAAGE